MSSVDRPDSGAASERARAAVEYADQEFRVFPLWWVRADGSCACGVENCQNAGKHPIGSLAPNGLKNATSDPGQIAKWWDQYPDANIGIATGNGIVVLDADKKPGADGLLHLEELFRWAGREAVTTAISRTGSGGEHWLFKYDPKLRVGNRQNLRILDSLKPSAIDVRGDGGYIVAPPSTHRSGERYRWVTGLDSVAEIPPKILGAIARGMSDVDTSYDKMQARAAKVDSEEIRKIYEALAYIPADCSREIWVQDVGMPLHDHFGGRNEGFEIWNAWSETVDGQKDARGNDIYPGRSEVFKQWKSFKASKNPRGLRSLYRRAGLNGWQEDPATARIVSIHGHTAIPVAEPDDEELRQAFEAEVIQGFPAHVIESMTGPMRSIHQWCMYCSRRPDPVIAMGATLAIVAASTGRRFVGPTDASASTAVAILAPSGAGKDKALECVKNFMALHPELRSGVLEDAPHHRMQLDECLFENSGQLLMLLDEYGAALKKWLASDNKSDTLSPQIRKLINHGRTVYKLSSGSRENATIKHHGVEKWKAGVFGPSFCLIGFATPGQFFKGMSADALTDGFMGRHILLATREDQIPRMQFDGRADTMEPPSDACMWARLMSEVPVPKTVRMDLPVEDITVGGEKVEMVPETGPRDAKVVPYADGSDELFREIAEEIDAKTNKHLANGETASSAMETRLTGQVAALSLLFALGQSEDPSRAEVRERDILNAYAVLRWAADYSMSKIEENGAVRMEIEDAFEKLTASIIKAGGKPVYRSKFSKKPTYIRHIQKLWQLVVEDPRFDADEKKATLREAPKARV